jgi:hypothetical protein
VLPEEKNESFENRILGIAGGTLTGHLPVRLATCLVSEQNIWYEEENFTQDKFFI